MSREFGGIKWRVAKGFKESDPDYCDWTIKSRFGTLYRLGDDKLFAVLPTKQPKRAGGRAIEIGFDPINVKYGDDESYIYGTVADIPKFFKLLRKKQRVFTPEQREAARNRLAEARAKRKTVDA